MRKFSSRSHDGGVEPGELLGEIDAVCGLTSFLLDDLASAEHVLSF
jgi:hypothetical protein